MPWINKNQMYEGYYDATNSNCRSYFTALCHLASLRIYCKMLFQFSKNCARFRLVVQVIKILLNHFI